MVAIEVGGQEPSAAELSQLISLAQQRQIRVVFAAPQFSQRTTETIAAYGIQFQREKLSKGQ